MPDDDYAAVAIWLSRSADDLVAAAVQIALETTSVQFLPARAGDHGEGVSFAWRG